MNPFEKMKKSESLSWLYKIFNTSYFYTWKNIGYLYSYPKTGIHHYLTRILQFEDEHILYLVHIMFYHSDELISYPIMDMLIERCKYSRSISLRLFFMLKSYRKYLTKNQIGFYRIIVQKLMECDRYRRDKARRTGVIKIRQIQSVKKKSVDIKKLKYEQLENKMRLIRDEINKANGGETGDPCLLASLEEHSMCMSYSTSIVDTLCDAHRVTSEHKTTKKSTENKKHEKCGKNENKEHCSKRYMSRTYPIIDFNRGTGNMSSLFLFLCSASMFFLKENLLMDVISYEKMFYVTKPYMTVIPRRIDSTLKGNINFLDCLISISFRLKTLPKNIRQRALEIELEYLNLFLPADLCMPFSNGRKVLSLDVDHSKTLSSVENCPFILTYECAKKIRKTEKRFYNDIYLLRQLYALEKTGNENQIIRDKIIEQLMHEYSTHVEPETDETVNIEDNTSTPVDKKKKHEKESLPFFGKRKNWKDIQKDVLMNSKFKDLNPTVKCIIVKTGNELGPELLALELLREIKNIMSEEKMRIWLKPYRIYTVFHNAGFVEVVSSASSIHEIKKMNDFLVGGKSFLKKFYYETFGNCIDKAIDNFLESLVGYSLITYFLALKDRHNGNILIDDEGHIVHVDFGFVLGLHPGFYCVETAPFKMSNEYIYLLGNRIDEFKKLFVEGFMAVRKHGKRLIQILEICMNNPKYKFLDISAVDCFKSRMKSELNTRELEEYVIGLVDWSLKSMTTGLYDSYQYFSNGYLK